MRWRGQSINEYFSRIYHEWRPRQTFWPHRCSNPTCGIRMWFEQMLSRLEGGYCGNERLWACSQECANVIGR